jgi:hypothetical protein
MINWFKRHSVSILDEKWNVIKENVKIKHIPRTHELIFLEETNKYYRVVNIIYNFQGGQGIYIIIEEYTDDFALLEKTEKL